MTQSKKDLAEWQLNVFAVRRTQITLRRRFSRVAVKMAEALLLAEQIQLAAAILLAAPRLEVRVHLVVFDFETQRGARRQKRYALTGRGNPRGHSR